MQKNSLGRLRVPIAIAVPIVLAAFLSLRSISSAKQDSPNSPSVKTILAKNSASSTSLEIAGFVRGESRADIAPMASGRILRIFKHEGDVIKKGEVLATIDASQADAQVAAAQASADALKKTLDDSKKYYDQLVKQSKEAPSSDATDEAIKSAKRARDLQIQAAQDQLTAAQGALSIAQAGRNNSTLTAPFAGTITAVYAREGGFANFSTPLMAISATGSQEIETYVSATDGRAIAVGATVAMQTPSDQPISGIVTAVSAGSDAQSLKTLVRIHINNENGDIHLGDFLHGQIMIPHQQDTISIPANAIVSRGGDQVVFILDENNIAKEEPIKTGAQHNGLIDVTQGLSEGQKIVIEGQQYLINGSSTTPYDAN